jgi:HK97 family phage major capsid protein
MTTFADQYIATDGKLRAKAAQFDDGSVPSPDDIAEMRNMEGELETLKLRMELAAIQDGLVPPPVPAQDISAPSASTLDTAIEGFLASDHFKARSKSAYRLGGDPPLAMKTLFTTTAGWTPRAPFSGIVANAPVRPPTVLSVIQQIPTSESAVVYMVESTHTDSSANVAEGAKPNEQAYAYTTTTAQVRRISAILPVTEEVLADVPQIQALLQNNVTRDLEARVESQVLTGNGTAPNFRGVINLTGINSQAKGTGETILDALYKGKVKAISTGFIPPDVVVIHPDDLQEIVLEKSVGAATDAGAANDVVYPAGYIWGNPVSGPPAFLWGMRVIETTGVTAKTALLGAFGSQLHLRDRQDVTFRFGTTGTQFAEAEMTIRADIRAAFYSLRDSAFCKVTGLRA